jgi:hypothetical protein
MGCPQTIERDLLCQYNYRALFEGIGNDEASAFILRDEGNPCPVSSVNYFTKCSVVSAVMNEEAMTVAKAVVTDSFCLFGEPQELKSKRSFYSNIVLFRKGCKA